MRRHAIEFDGARGRRRVDVTVATTPFERMRGLLARARPAAGQGLLLPACRLIHTFGIRYPIDAVYLGRDGCVLKVTAGLAPRRVDGHLRAYGVLEMAAGASVRCGIAPGVRLPLFDGARP